MNEPDEPGIGTWLMRLPARALIGLVALYKLLFSPLFAGSCRFVPSCSAYASEALHRHGAMKGTWLAAWRLARCHPFARGGLDQVPLGTDPRRGHNWQAPV